MQSPENGKAVSRPWHSPWLRLQVSFSGFQTLKDQTTAVQQLGNSQKHTTGVFPKSVVPTSLPGSQRLIMCAIVPIIILRDADFQDKMARALRPEGTNLGWQPEGRYRASRARPD